MYLYHVFNNYNTKCNYLSILITSRYDGLQIINYSIFENNNILYMYVIYDLLLVITK